jgi:hypothetical protein
MTVEDPNDPPGVDRQARIHALRRRAEELAAAEAAAGEAEGGPPIIVERFWQSVLDYETAPVTTDFEQLARAGVDLPAPESLSDGELPGKLWEVVRQLARRRVFLERTDHLSDRELYSRLWHKFLRDEHPDLPVDDSNAWHIDLLGGCTEADVFLEHKYYATEAERRDWLGSYPDYAMPAHEDPPYDRDRHLPTAEYRPLAGPDDTRTGDTRTGDGP